MKRWSPTPPTIDPATLEWVAAQLWRQGDYHHDERDRARDDYEMWTHGYAASRLKGAAQQLRKIVKRVAKARGSKR